MYSVLSNHPKFAKVIKTTRITETGHSGFKYLFYYILDRNIFYVLFLLYKSFLQKEIRKNVPNFFFVLFLFFSGLGNNVSGGLVFFLRKKKLNSFQ